LLFNCINSEEYTHDYYIKVSSKKTGVALAMAVTGLISKFLAGNTIAADSDTIELSSCNGLNIYKGHNNYGSDSNSCVGQAHAKGLVLLALQQNLVVTSAEK
jgi:hypothetical protein